VFLTCYYYVRRLDGAQQAENELLTQVGPGTAMGAVMRRYWIPVLLREEVPDPDGDPVRVADGFRRIDTTGHSILPGLVAAVMCGAKLQTQDASAFGSFFIDRFFRFGVTAVRDTGSRIPGRSSSCCGRGVATGPGSSDPGPISTVPPAGPGRGCGSGSTHWSTCGSARSC
jgi:hypothetical protein